jgi:beta-glucosidase-like glycosyl hydrolase
VHGYAQAPDVKLVPLDDKNWIEQQLERLTLRQKIGQLMMVAMTEMGDNDGVFSKEDSKSNDAMTFAFQARKKEIIDMIEQDCIGGIICFRGTPQAQAKLLTELQTLSMARNELPLLVGQDAEWGLSMRLQGVARLPKNMTLGAISNKALLRTFGRFVGIMCRTVGVHINFAPVVDSNTNQDNPVIGMRAFHENVQEVHRNASYVVDGMLIENIVPCIKHAPGHGDTDKDSHKDLPVLRHPRARLDKVELAPFKRLVKVFGSRIAMMTGHIAVPALTGSESLPASLSKQVINNIIRVDQKFGGLVITDALNMKAIKNFYSSAQAALAAFMAGNDILLFVEDVAGAIDLIENLVTKSALYKAQLDASVRRILRVKRQIIEQGRVFPLAIDPEVLASDPRVLTLKRTLYEAAITRVQDKHKLLPLKKPYDKVGYIKIGGTKESLETVAATFQGLTTGYVALDESVKRFEAVLAGMKQCKSIIVAVGRVHEQQSPYGNVPTISPLIQDCLVRLKKSKQPFVLGLLTSPYALRFFKEISTVIEAYEDDCDAEIGMLKAMFGANQATGILPISVQ